MMSYLQEIGPKVIAAAMRGYKEPELEKYDPDQPRDESGRWGGGGSSFNPTSHETARQSYRQSLGTDKVTNEALVASIKVKVSAPAALRDDAIAAVAHVVADRSLARDLEGMSLEFKEMGGLHGRHTSTTLYLDAQSLKQYGPGFGASVIRHELEHVKLSRQGVPSFEQERRVRFTTGLWAGLKYTQMKQTNPSHAAGFKRAAEEQGQRIRKFSPDQPRDESGKWSESGEGGRADSPAAPTSGMISEPGYLYHATNVERLYEIAEDGELATHKPDEFTDQEAWPDGGEEPRVYFNQEISSTVPFLPEGKGAVVRTKRELHSIRDERYTGDSYSRHPIDIENLEYLTESGAWRPVSDLVKKIAKSADDLDDLGFEMEMVEDEALLSALSESYLAGAGDAQAVAGIDLEAPSELAMSYARRRAAELVGMRRQADGTLVRNPNPKWAITDTIRDDVKSLVRQATEEGWSSAKLSDSLQDIFSEGRANMIARTELGFAYNGAAADTYEEAGADFVHVLDGDGCLPKGHDDEAEEPDGVVGEVDLESQANGQIWPVSAMREYPLGHPHCVRAFPLYFGPRPGTPEEESE